MSVFQTHYLGIRYPEAEHAPNHHGLRRAQRGALHAIAAHFERYRNPADVSPAIVVMPTGSGKTAVLMLTAFALKARRVLVVTSSSIVRKQISDEFRTLRILLETTRSLVLSEEPADSAEPAVTTIIHKRTTSKLWEELKEFEVVVSTPYCLVGKEIVPPTDADLFDLVLIDEAHHAPAQTWSQLFTLFPNARKVLFTATPFRRDKQRVQGRIIFEFSIREALEDGIFSSIRYHPVHIPRGVTPEERDILIAQHTAEAYATDHQRFDHRVLVRVDTKKKAKALATIYSEHTALKLKVVFSELTDRQVEAILVQLRDGELDGIICVDMLGEGFDFPNLKIAAMHSPHKSLTITLQFIGRLARTGPSIGTEATFVAATDETIRIGKEQLYQEDAVWREIIPELYQQEIVREERRRAFYESFGYEITAPFSQDQDVIRLPVHALTPSRHVKIYRINGKVDIHKDIRLPGLEIARRDITDEQSTVILITQEVKPPTWTRARRFARIEYDLFVVYWHKPTQLLFINSSRKSETIYYELAQGLVDGTFEPLLITEINRVLFGLESLEFFNIGMRNRLPYSQTESYRILTGANAHKAVRRTDSRLFHRGHVFGRGEKQGQRVTLGYSSSSKVWSTTTSQETDLLGLLEWCNELAERIQEERIIHTNSELDYLTVGQKLTQFPDDMELLAVDWNEELYAHPFKFIHTSPEGVRRQVQVLDTELRIVRDYQAPNCVRLEVHTPSWQHMVDFSPTKQPLFRSATPDADLQIQKGRDVNLVDVVSFLNEHPVRLFTHDLSIIMGNQILMDDEAFQAFDPEKFETPNWNALQVDITREFGDAAPGLRSIHDYLKTQLVTTSDIVFYDHDTGELADFITFKKHPAEVVIQLHHVKSSAERNPGERVEDVYEVCGQAIKSLRWLRIDTIKSHISRRLENDHDFIVGDLAGINRLVREAQRDNVFINFEIVIIQPGIRKARITNKLLMVIGATSDYVTANGCGNLRLIVSG